MGGSYCSVQCCNGPNADLKDSECGMMLGASWDLTRHIQRLENPVSSKHLTDERGQRRMERCAK